MTHRRGRLEYRAALAALAAGIAVACPGPAAAQGIFDFLFGGFQREAPPPPSPYPNTPPSPLPRVAPAPLGPESVTGGGESTGHAVAFCVRLCDGQNFPMEQMPSTTPLETCRAVCPYSKTKVFFGSEIGAAVAQDGQHYTNLDTAFLYRKQLVANCTCNGRDAFGLRRLDVNSDPTLRPGDIVSTKDGLQAFTGKSATGSTFRPVDPATLPANLQSGAPPARAAASAPADPDDDPGTVVPAPAAKPVRH